MTAGWQNFCVEVISETYCKNDGYDLFLIRQSLFGKLRVHADNMPGRIVDWTTGSTDEFRE